MRFPLIVVVDYLLQEDLKSGPLFQFIYLMYEWKIPLRRRANFDLNGWSSDNMKGRGGPGNAAETTTDAFTIKFVSSWPEINVKLLCFW